METESLDRGIHSTLEAITHLAPDTPLSAIAPLQYLTWKFRPSLNCRSSNPLEATEAVSAASSVAPSESPKEAFKASPSVVTAHMPRRAMGTVRMECRRKARAAIGEQANTVESKRTGILVLKPGWKWN